jgi:hypothetical protein
MLHDLIKPYVIEPCRHGARRQTGHPVRSKLRLLIPD